MARVLFHVSPRANRASIRGEGLRVDVDGWDHRYVWVFDCPVVAAELASHAWGQLHGESCDVWAVDVTGLEVVPDPHQGWDDSRLDGHSFAVAGPVAPGRVRLAVAGVDDGPAGNHACPPVRVPENG